MTRTTTKDRRRRTRGTDDGGGGGSRRRAQGGGGRRRRPDEEDDAGRRGRDADDEARSRGRHADEARSRGRDAEDEARSRAPRDLDEDEPLDRDDDDERDDGDRQDGGSGGGVFAELKNVAADAALAVLAPVAKKAATGAAKYAVKKAPELLEDTVKPMLEDAGGVKGLVGQAMSSDGPAGGLLSKLTPGGGDEDDDGGKQGAGDGTGKGRRMPIQQAVDVAAPIDIVYDQWTQFEDYPKFMHRVQRVEQRDESHVAFHAKVWGINRMWEAEIVEQRPDERIVFKSVNGVQLTGVVTFHDMAERLTRIELNIDVDPDGPIEKIARGARMVKRAARGDLKRFKAYVEMHEDETGAWRGEIQDGDVVSEPGDESEDDERYEDEDEQAEASYDEQEPDDRAEEDDEAADDEEDEPEASQEEEDTDDDDEEEDEKPAPARKRSRSTASRSKSTSKRSRSNGGDPGKPKTASRAKKSSSSRSRGSAKSGSSSSSRKRTASKSGSKR
jgi:uncharacterized membrane protein